MKRFISIATALIILLLVSSVFAADKVVVIPLQKCADGLTSCSGKCVDNRFDPNYCGDCSTQCGAGMFCDNGKCSRSISGSTCLVHDDCFSNYCKDNICADRRIVFISSSDHTGNLNGLTGADNICQGLADAARLPGIFKAWLSDTTTGPSSTARFTHSEYDYILVDGTVIANGWVDLTDGTLDHTINLDENGADLLGHYAWTSSHSNGDPRDDGTSCQDWKTAASNYDGGHGDSLFTTAEWTYKFLSFTFCHQTNKLYCFEQ